MLPAGHSDKQHSFFIRSRYLFQHTTVSQSPLTGQNKKTLLFTSFSVTRFAGYYQQTTKKPAVNDRLVKCNTLKGHLKSYDICFYIIPANTDAPTTVSNPATAMARLLMAPSTGPSSMALAVPIAWADVPSPRPLAIGSSIFAIL